MLTIVVVRALNKHIGNRCIRRGSHLVGSLSRFSTHLFSICIFALLLLGWSQRNEFWLTAEKGWGYALGIIGGSLMLILLLYPLRKHWKLARNWFGIRHWFKMHMLFGILGPVLILFHSNFQLGSLNSNIALFSMLLVSGSGVIGRYAYQKIHRGLYGTQIEFSELRAAYEKSKSHFGNGDFLAEETRRLLAKIEKDVEQRKIPFFTALYCYHQIKKLQKSIAKRCREKAESLLDNRKELAVFAQEVKYLLTGITQLKRMASYALFARLFSLWHIFHLPIFIMMIIAGIVHVFAVHIY